MSGKVPCLCGFQRSPVIRFDDLTHLLTHLYPKKEAAGRFFRVLLPAACFLTLLIALYSASFIALISSCLVFSITSPYKSIVIANVA